MLVKFKIENKNGIVEYEVFGKEKDGYLIFMDKHIANTLYKIKIMVDKVIIIRTGSTKMELAFLLKQKLQGSYQNVDGLFLSVSTFTRQLEISSNGIFIEYDFFINEEYQTTNKLSIKY